MPLVPFFFAAFRESVNDQYQNKKRGDYDEDGQEGNGGVLANFAFPLNNVFFYIHLRPRVRAKGNPARP
jgi:hypothetical protein